MEIHVLPDNGLLYYGGFHVNLAAGLEDSLVATIRPVWNKTGVCLPTDAPADMPVAALAAELESSKAAFCFAVAIR